MFVPYRFAIEQKQRAARGAVVSIESRDSSIRIVRLFAVVSVQFVAVGSVRDL